MRRGRAGRPVLILCLTAAVAVAAMAAGSRDKEDAEADRLYEYGRALMDGGEWGAAIESFEKVIEMQGKVADAALYWKAYSLRKLTRLPEALASIEDLRRLHQDSSWLDDARALELEIRGSTKGGKVSPEAESNEEMKLVAINALLNLEPERAMPMLEKLLRTSSSRRLREQALFVLVQSGSPRAREILLEVARGKEHPELQRKAIEYLGIFAGPETGPLLKEILASTTDASIKRAVLNAYMVSGDTESLAAIARQEKEDRVRFEAISLLGAQGAKDELLRLYRSEPSVEGREQVLHAFGICGGTDELIEVARSEKEPRLRRAAIHGLAIGGGEEAGAALMSFYTGERDLDVRKAVLEALMIRGDVKTLIGIARRETNPELKKAAVEKLSVMGSKEATEFLLEILND